MRGQNRGTPLLFNFYLAPPKLKLSCSQGLYFMLVKLPQPLSLPSTQEMITWQSVYITVNTVYLDQLMQVSDGKIKRRNGCSDIGPDVLDRSTMVRFAFQDDIMKGLKVYFYPFELFDLPD